MENLRAERRARRSDEHGLALRFQLESTLQRGRLAAVALSDHEGLLVAWAGEDGLCQELGAVAPLVARGAPPRLPGQGLQGDDVAVRTLDCFGKAMFLSSLGGGVARDALLAHSARGIQRILTAN
ncbi:MAG: hypothetical protein OXU20_30595 [Myxococcales bacterium]|nr:hypothetical protein [Myxococcales bacterium]MDD9970812.1 hypothetical protein [Myxococcales bacterium]